MSQEKLQFTLRVFTNMSRAVVESGTLEPLVTEEECSVLQDGPAEEADLPVGDLYLPIF